MNKVLFEISYIGGAQGFVYMILAFGTFLFLYHRFNEIGIRIITICIVGLLMVYTLFLIDQYKDVVIAYKNGNYVEIEGKVENYSVSLRGNVEYFTVEGVRFKCSYGSPAWGYQKQEQKGNEIIISGRHLRIRYIPLRHENVIVYIEQMMPEEWDTD